MIVELINTGTELMVGRVLNTHQQWLCSQLSDLGYHVSRQVAVPDTGPAIVEAVRESLSRAQLVITTGGLGPTSDDLTRDLIAGLLGKTLHEDPTSLERIQNYFEARKRPIPPLSRIQAQVPEGALVLPNNFGTAPGLAIEVRPNSFSCAGQPSWLVMLPGPPRELRPMFTASVVPLLAKELPPPAPFFSRTLRTTGIGETIVQEKIARPLESMVGAGLEIGYCAAVGRVDVRLSASGAQAAAMVAEAESVVRSELGGAIFGEADEEIEDILVRVLTERGKTLALAESCTGGLVANRITNVPGASAVLLAGLVTYSNAAKEKFLGVKSATLAAHGAVSAEVAREMAEGAREKCGADFALSLTGIAGPSGGSEAKPVGTVFIALAGPFDTIVERHLYPFDRPTFKWIAAQQVMDMLRRKLLE
jgi:nicotinamide-nucleotide amidase